MAQLLGLFCSYLPKYMPRKIRELSIDDDKLSGGAWVTD